MMHSAQADPAAASPSPGGLDFLWLELTNRCNLSCAHCYADSGPRPSVKDVLTLEDYEQIIDDAAVAGCRAVQFIGGEPTLHRGLPQMIRRARAAQFETIEVYTNGTILTQTLLDCFVAEQVRLAVSVYADEASIHDSVTGRSGSHRKTMANLRRMTSAGLKVRVGVIAMEANRDAIDRTVEALRAFKVEHVAVDRARNVGRGRNVSKGEDGLQALCGHCWNGSLCVSANGAVSSCVMSKAWPVGEIATGGLEGVLGGDRLRQVRELIRSEVWLPRQIQGGASASCDPDGHPDCMPRNPCSPSGGCDPCHPTCSPQDPHCTPQCDPPLPRFLWKH